MGVGRVVVVKGGEVVAGREGGLLFCRAGGGGVVVFQWGGGVVFNPVLTGDGGMKLTTALCNERTSCFHYSPDLRLRVLTGCTERPLRGSLYCRSHQAPAALGPEVHTHCVEAGQMEFKLASSRDFQSAAGIPAGRLRQ